MTHDDLRLIWFFQILDFLFRQGLTLDLESLVDPFDAVESYDGTRYAPTDPRESYCTHLPAFLLRKLLNTADDLWTRQNIIITAVDGHLTF